MGYHYNKPFDICQGKNFSDALANFSKVCYNLSCQRMTTTDMNASVSSSSKKKFWKPRVLIPFNTGTRVILSKRDKMNSRQYLNKLAKDY